MSTISKGNGISSSDGECMPGKGSASIYGVRTDTVSVEPDRGLCIRATVRFKRNNKFGIHIGTEKPGIRLPGMIVHISREYRTH